MTIIAELAKILLWACIEDYAGLWELLWEVNSKFPEYSESERKHLSLEVAKLLLERGGIKLYRCQESYGNLSELDLESARAVLNGESNWEAPDFEGISIRAGATKKGEALYQASTFDSFC